MSIKVALRRSAGTSTITVPRPAITAFPTSEYEEIIAAWLAAGEDAVVSHESALALLKLSDVIPDTVHLTVPRTRRFLRIPGVAIHTVSDPIPMSDIVTREGVRATTAARSIWDAAEAGTTPDQIERAVREALTRGMALPERFQEHRRYSKRTNALVILFHDNAVMTAHATIDA